MSASFQNPGVSDDRYSWIKNHMFCEKLDRYPSVNFDFLCKAIREMPRNDATSSRELVTTIFYLGSDN